MELFLALILAATPAFPGPSGIELERLIDTSVQLPGTTGNIEFEAVEPTPCGDGVFFLAIQDDIEPRYGAYFVSSAELRIVADPDTPVPGSDDAFQNFFQPRCVGGEAAFLAVVEGAGESVYRWGRDGQIELVQEAWAQIDGYEIRLFFDLSANTTGVGIQGRLAFGSSGFPGTVLVVKPYSGAPRVVADSSVILPGQTEPVTIFSLPFVVGSDLVFRARTSSNMGIYRWSEGQGISVVADHQTPVPGAVGTFWGFGMTALLSEGLAFGAESSGGQGIYLVEDGRIEPLVVPGDVTENGETIAAAIEPSGTGSLLAFTATTVESPFFPAAFARMRGGKLHRILGTGDIIEGRQVALVKARAEGASVAMLVYGDANPILTIIYRATFERPIVEIPALSWGGLWTLAILLAAVGTFLMRR